MSGLWASGVSFSIETADWIIRRRSGFETEENLKGKVSERLSRNEVDNLGLVGEDEDDELGDVMRENEDEAEREIEVGIF